MQVLDRTDTQGSIGPPAAPVGSHCGPSGTWAGSLGVLLPCMRTTLVKIENWNHRTISSRKSGSEGLPPESGTMARV